MESEKLTIVGIISLSAVFWIFSQSATGGARKVYNMFLSVLLLSMVVLNWNKIKPIFVKG